MFDELDHLALRTLDPKWIAAARNADTFDPLRTTILPTGEVFAMRWVPTSKGVALSFSNCSACHVAHLKDGTTIVGAPALAGRQNGPTPLLVAVHQANRLVNSAIPFRMGDEPFGMWLYRAFGVPWAKDDIHERLKTMTPADLPGLLAAGARGGAIPRWNGSVFYPVKVPDLIGVKDRKYFDATATHLHRGIGDLMRYAALVSTAEPARIGQYDLAPTRCAPRRGQTARRGPVRAGDVRSIRCSRRPIRILSTNSARAGQEIFTREGCATCHVPPLYTSNKVTLARGFTPPSDAPKTLDVLPVSVGTDPGLALRTRKGTGYYKVPSLKGVWYRGHYLHDGSAASLEEMFDPDRLNESHIRGGFRPGGAPTGAIQGHEFGLRLNPVERAQLLAFLRTL